MRRPHAAGRRLDRLETLGGAAGAAGRTDLSAAVERLAAIRPAPARPVVCHGDLHPFNLLVEGRRWTLLDWTAAALAEPAYDVAFTRLLLANPPLDLPGREPPPNVPVTPSSCSRPTPVPHCPP